MLAAQCVSIVASVTRARTMWSLVRESGRLPERCSQKDCGNCGRRSYDSVAANAYIVVVSRGTYIGPLCSQNVWNIVYRFVPALQRAIERDAEDGVLMLDEQSARWLCWEESVKQRIREGLFSRGDECRCCPWEGVCSNCSCLMEHERMILVRDCFNGVLPYGFGHWFTGVTDAGGAVGKCDLPWLMCWDGVLQSDT